MATTPTPEPATTRAALHRVAVHVLARRRAAVTGRFGLRPTPGGFGTPAFGGPDREEVLRVSGTALVRERRDHDAMHTAVQPIGGTSLAGLAAFAGVDLDAPLWVGHDTTGPGDRDAPLTVSPVVAVGLAAWFADGAAALDRVVAAADPEAAPSVAQLWPEHFDLAVDVGAGATRVNLGVSPGDGFHDGPYAYVGPWTADRPGDAAFWNAPFGALLPADTIAGTPDAVRVVADFLTRGLALLAG